MAKSRKKAFALSADGLAALREDNPDVRQLQSLLARYGHLSGSFCPGSLDEPTRAAVSTYQSFYHLYPENDGEVDDATVLLLNQPRCGVPDLPPGQRSRTGRLAAYVAVGSTWSSPQLRFTFLNDSPDLQPNRQRDIVREAFDRWSQVSALTFAEVQAAEEAELSVSFHQGSHGDGYPFDDSGGADGNTLAHAFFPPPNGGSWAGSLHFDEFEQWKDEPGGGGTRLYNVALHEIGHLLGLSHSQDTNAIMYAYYAENRNDLRADDIAGIQSLYGAAQAQPKAIELGESVSGHLQARDDTEAYQVTVQNKLLVRLDGPANEDFDLYVRFGSPAGTGEGDYDHVSYGVTSQELVTIDAPQAGTYYLVVHSYRGSGSFSIEAEVA